MKKELIGKVSGNILGMMADLCHKLQHGARTPEELETFLKGENPFTTETIIISWQRFFKKYFNIKINLSNLKIPLKQEGFDRLLIVPKGFTSNQVFEVCKKHFSCEKYGIDLDKETEGKNERETKETYAIWVRDRIEADEELNNISAEIIKKREINTETLLEREIHELKFFDERSKHLDLKNITLCVGSRRSNGLAPCVRWYNGRLWVYWYRPQDANSVIRARAVVSF